MDWEWVRDACKEVSTGEDRREFMTKATNIFRVLIKTLFKAGIVTDRTRKVYAAWVDVEEMKAEGDEMVGDAIAKVIKARAIRIVQLQSDNGTAVKTVPVQ